MPEVTIDSVECHDDLVAAGLLMPDTPSHPPGHWAIWDVWQEWPDNMES